MNLIKVFENLQKIESVLKIEKVADSRFFVHIKPLKKDKSFLIEVSLIFPDNSSSSSLPNLWVKYGFTKQLLKSYICINTYLTDKNDICIGKYNPTVTENHKINFDNLLEVSEENIIYIVEKISLMYMHR